MKKVNFILFAVLIIAIVAMILIFNKSSDKKPLVKYPFYLSTKYSISNIRSGPGEDYPIVWIYKEKNIPFKVIASYQNWYQIENNSGKIGWIFKNITSSLKTAITVNKIEVYSSYQNTNNKIATIDKDIIVKVCKIKDDYAQIYLKLDKVKIKGWTLKENLWGNIN